VCTLDDPAPCTVAIRTVTTNGKSMEQSPPTGGPRRQSRRDRLISGSGDALDVVAGCLVTVDVLRTVLGL
jgi:hypothetical protein